MIRDATPADAAATIALWHACGLTRPWNDPQADFDRAVGGPASAVLVAERDGAIVGSVMLGYDGHRGWVYYVAVAAKSRRTGLGRALMAAAEARLRTLGAPKLQLMVREGNTEALAFYQALGLTDQKVVTLGRFLETDRPATQVANP